LEVVVAEEKSYYSKWYEKNKAKLAKSRKKKYDTDPEYKKNAISQSRKYRAKKQPPKPEGYDLTLQQVAEHLKVTQWRLLEWRKKDYFPEPVNHGGRFWFTPPQAGLLKGIADFFAKYGTRARHGLEDLVNLTFANWG
jgi:hypothetical protein